PGALLGSYAAKLLRRPAESAARGASRTGPDRAVVRYRRRDPTQEPGRAAGGAERADRAGDVTSGDIFARSAKDRVAQEPVWERNRLRAEPLGRTPTVHRRRPPADRQQHGGAGLAALRNQ